MEILDTLYDDIVSDIRSEATPISEKYKSKYDELGKPTPYLCFFFE